MFDYFTLELTIDKIYNICYDNISIHAKMSLALSFANLFLAEGKAMEKTLICKNCGEDFPAEQAKSYYKGLCLSCQERQGLKDGDHLRDFVDACHDLSEEEAERDRLIWERAW